MINIGVNPVAIAIGSLAIRWYGILVALAIGVLILWVVWQVKKGLKVSYDNVLTAALVGIPSGIIISKLLHLWDRMDYYRYHPEQMFTTEGLTIYGAILGAALGVWVYSKVGKFEFGYFADAVVPGLVLAQVVGRIGCTINGCCYGVETSLPWGIVYTHPESFAALGVRHPTTVYEIIFLLIVFVALLKLRGRFEPDGSLFLGYLGIYSLWRVGIDFLREGTPFFVGLHQAQIIALLTLAVVVPLMAYKTRWVKEVRAEVEPETEAEDKAEETGEA